MKTIEERIRELPPDLQAEVVDFLEFLAQRASRKKGTVRQDSVGGLAGFRDQYTSCELQRKSLEWQSG